MSELRRIDQSTADAIRASVAVAESATRQPAVPGLLRDFVGLPLALSRDVRVDPEEYSHITRQILAGAIEVHRALGPGLESIYTPCLQYELTVRKLRFVAQRPIPIVYKGMSLEACYRIDLMVEDVVVVEVKSVATVLPVHQAQLLTYMQLTECPTGLLINFNVPRLMDGVKRLINPRAAKSRTESTGVTR